MMLKSYFGIFTFSLVSDRLSLSRLIINLNLSGIRFKAEDYTRAE